MEADPRPFSKNGALEGIKGFRSDGTATCLGAAFPF
jgi:hypothetical protein